MKFVTLRGAQFSGAEVSDVACEGRAPYQGELPICPGSSTRLGQRRLGFKRSNGIGPPPFFAGGTQNNDVSFAAVGRAEHSTGPAAIPRGGSEWLDDPKISRLANSVVSSQLLVTTRTDHSISAGTVVKPTGPGRYQERTLVRLQPSNL